MCLDCDCVDILFFTFAASCWWVIDASHCTCWTSSLCCGAGFVMERYVASCVRRVAFCFSAACCSLSWESCFSATAYCWKDAPPSPVASSLVANWRSKSWHASSSRVYRRLKIPRDRWVLVSMILTMAKESWIYTWDCHIFNCCSLILTWGRNIFPEPNRSPTTLMPWGHDGAVWVCAINLITHCSIVWLYLIDQEI